MIRRRAKITITVSVDLDDVPGAYYQPEDWVQMMTGEILSRANHYNPKLEATDIEVSRITQ